MLLHSFLLLVSHFLQKPDLEICSLSLSLPTLSRQFARVTKKMTLDVIYPSREFVLMSARHSRLLSPPVRPFSPAFQVLANWPPRLSCVLTKQIARRDRVAIHFFSFSLALSSSLSPLRSFPPLRGRGAFGGAGMFRVFVWHDVEIDDRGSRAAGWRSSVFHFRVLGRLNNATACGREREGEGADLLFRELLSCRCHFSRARLAPRMHAESTSF